MKLVLSFLLLALAAITQAASATGDRLLSIWEDVEDQKLYSKFIGDLESMHNPRITTGKLATADSAFSAGRGYKITHATPKQEDLRLEHLGEKTFDHLVIFPTKSKGESKAQIVGIPLRLY